MTAQWRPMTPKEIAAAIAMSPARVTYPVGTYYKKIARSVASQAASDAPRITDKQADAMWRVIVRFRRQIPAEIVREAEWQSTLRSIK